MITSELAVSPRLLELVDGVVVAPGGSSARTAGQTYEEDSPSALARVLGPVLYQTVHTGRDKPLDVAVRSFRDPSYEALLARATPALARQITAPVMGADGSELIVLVDGVRIRVPRRVRLQDASDEEADGTASEVSFPLPCQRPGLSPGFFYLSDGRTPALTGPVLRLYARIEDPSCSPEVWRACTGLLQSVGTTWHAKVLSTRQLYPRHDALVVYLQRDGWRHARRLAQHLQDTGRLGVGSSPFTRPVTESVSCAFEPDDDRPAFRGLSFGQHRANVLAQALITHATLPDHDSRPVSESLHVALLDAGIDPAEPARNLASPATDVLGIR